MDVADAPRGTLQWTNWVVMQPSDVVLSEQEGVIVRGRTVCENCGWRIKVLTITYPARAVLYAYCYKCQHLDMREIVDTLADEGFTESSSA